MTISYPLTPPSAPTFSGITLTPKSAVGESRSPFTFESQYYAHQGQMWQGELRLPPMTRAEAEPWIAFLLSLNGKAGTFLMGIAGAGTPRGAATGTPLVQGASQTGQSLVTDGWTAGVTGILKAGDYFQLGSGVDSYLHKLLADANTDGSGNATFDIWPRLRVSPADNAAITVLNPKGTWRLATNDMPFDIGVGNIYGVGFLVVEDL